MNAYSSNYLNQQIASASPEQILIMLYDGALRFLSQAGTAIEQRQVEQRNHFISKTRDIITELSATLDHEIGGQIADDLAALYDFMLRELNQANIKNDMQALSTVEHLLTELRETWIQAIDITRHGSAGVQPQEQASYRPLSVAL
ncbi:MAG: flagellar export chaperone FliS [Desulfobulbaceae bacterium A2]|nr:MAG: flagellar export chaperone FliS [Desulfobulbaceae bacterium A2]